MMGGPGFLFGGFFGFIFWILVACLVVGFLAHLSSSNSDSNDEETDDDNAMSILKKRYAKGEITSHEFEKMKKDIS